MSNVTVSVIVPVFNDRVNLKYCLEALQNSSFKDFEIIVVDDCSIDSPAEITKDFGYRLISLPCRSGPAAARNIGAAAAQGRILLFMDADVICGPKTIEAMLNPLEQGWDACVGMYTPLPKEENFFSIYKNIFIWYYHNNAQGRVDWFWTACGAVKKDIFLKLGGFRERYFWKSVEDIDFGYRLTENKYRIFIQKDAPAKHFHYFSFSAILINDFKKARDWTCFNFTGNRSLRFKHPLAQCKYRGSGIIGSVLFLLTVGATGIARGFALIPFLIFLILPLLEKGFFASLLRYGGKRVFIFSLFFKPIDDLVISMGALWGAIVLFINPVKNHEAGNKNKDQG